MLNPSQVWNRIKTQPMFSGMKLSDFRLMPFGQRFAAVAAGATTPPTIQQFPGGAIILGITASAVDTTAALGTPGRNRTCFGLLFSYVNAEAIVSAAQPIAAEALLGSGEGTIFPGKEIVLAPTQNILCTVSNLCATILTIDVVYHALVWRFAQ